jgi:integrase
MVDRPSPRDHLLFVLGINSGLRISDILKMKVEDVLTEKGKPQVSYELREQKTGKTKKFPFGKNVQKAVEGFLSDFQGNQKDIYSLQEKAKMSRLHGNMLGGSSTRPRGQLGSRIRSGRIRYGRRLGITRISQGRILRSCSRSLITRLHPLHYGTSESSRMILIK